MRCLARAICIYATVFLCSQCAMQRYNKQDVQEQIVMSRVKRAQPPSVRAFVNTYMHLVFGVYVGLKRTHSY